MRAALPILAIATLLAACGQPRQLYVDHAWVRLAAVPGRPSAAYFTIHGGKEATKLLSVGSERVIEAQLHDTVTMDAYSTMKPLASVDVPAKSKVVFEPGGRHVMLFGLNPSVKAGGTMTFTFTFANGERILQDAAVVGAGNPQPK